GGSSKMLSSPFGRSGATVLVKQRPSVYGVLSSRWMTGGTSERVFTEKLAPLQKRLSGGFAVGERNVVSIERASPSRRSIQAVSVFRDQAKETVDLLVEHNRRPVIGLDGRGEVSRRLVAADQKRGDLSRRVEASKLGGALKERLEVR